MVVSPLLIAKLAFALVLVAGIVLSACARAPLHAVPSAELHRLVLGALVLDAVGAGALLTHHGLGATLALGGATAVTALAAWLSRGHNPDDPPDAREPADSRPPPEPDGIPRLDWARFERERRAWGAERPRQPSGRSRSES